MDILVILLRWYSLIPDVCHFHIFNPAINCRTLCSIYGLLFHINILGKFLSLKWLFLKVCVSSFIHWFIFIYKNRPVYMTSTTLNANIYVDLCTKFSKFWMWMYYKIVNMYEQNQWSISCPCARKAVHNRTFWRTLVTKSFKSFKEINFLKSL